MNTGPQTVLITGASRGIGLAIRDRLAAEGLKAVGTSRTASGSDEGMIALDVTDDRSVAASVAEMLKRHGRIDALVANAGFDLYGAVEDTTMAEFEGQIDTNLLGVVRMARAVLPVMRRQGKGRIVVIGSLGGALGLPMNAAYAASKFGLEGFCESLRLELAGSGIDICLVQPPAVATDTLDQSIRTVAGAASPLAGRTLAMVAAMRKAGRESRVTPEHVAERVAALVMARTAPVLRHPLGLQASLLPRMKALLPQRLFEAMLRRQFP
jgi:NAD(P)-dependent dehydrogenase (short-subunit alcohol dehydrogenase family)